MNRILTTPKEIDKNERVLYTGNHYISLPNISVKDASIKSINIVSLFNKALAQLDGEDYLFKPFFYYDGNMLNIKSIEAFMESYYIPCFNIKLNDDIDIKIRIYADLYEKGFVYEFESTKRIDIKLLIDLKSLILLRFNSHEIDFKKDLKVDKWLGNPVISIYSNSLSFALAFGGDKDFSYELNDDNLCLNIKCINKNAFYVTVNSDSDGASTTLIHFKRKGFENIYSELKKWLDDKKISYVKDKTIERILNENLFFNYFYAVAKDMESDRLIALTSRSDRYYVSGAFWERDSFLWSFPAVKLVDKELYQRLLKDMIILHSKNAGDHAHYIDGTVLYPGFELDEAASYFICVEDLEDYDSDIIKSLECVLKRIEKEYDEKAMLYRTFLLPSDDPSEYPFVTFDNVLLYRGFINLSILYKKIGQRDKAEFLNKRAEEIKIGIYKHLIKNIDGKDIFVWSCDNEGNFKIYNDPPGNLGLLPYYGFIDYKDEIFINTIEYYYSDRYKYYFKDARIKELACDHHPNTPSGLGLCGSILNPLKSKEAIEYVKCAPMDYGLLCESFDKDSGEAKTGVGFATGSGYLAMALYKVLIKEGEFLRVGAVVVKNEDFDFITKDEILNKILLILIKALDERLDIIVFPGLFGCPFENDRDYIEKILRMSINFKNIAICPGSYFEKSEGKVYHSSCIIQNGRILLRQRQLYLSRWERDLKLSRGENIGFADIKGFKTAILISTDTFYPQVSRYVAMSKADLVLSPVAIYGKILSYQLSALWQNVQQNLFFGVESGFKGKFDGKDFYSLSIIHAPLEMTERENGILEIERNNYSSIITAELDNEKRIKAVDKFNVLDKLNKKLYTNIFR